MIKILPIAVLSASLAAPVLQADFIANTYDLNPTLPSASTGPNFSTVFNPSTSAAAKIGFDSGFNASTAAAQQFTVPGPGIWELSQLTLPVALSGNASAAQINFEIRWDAGNSPNGPVLYAGNFNTLSAGGPINGTLANVSVPIPSVIVNGGSSYWVVLKQNTGLSGPGFNGMSWASADPGVIGNPPWAVDTLFGSGGAPPTGFSWTTSGPGDVSLAMALEGTDITSVPEAGQYAMAGVLFVGIAGYSIRKRIADSRMA